MPSLRARAARRALVAVLRAVRGRAGGPPRPDAPTAQLEAYALELRGQVERLAARAPVPAGVHDLAAPGAAVPCRWVVHRDALGPASSSGEVADPDRLLAAERIVLHLHGGGYILGSPRTHRALAAQLSRRAAGPVLLPDYRLAPEHRCPAALDDAEATYRWLTEHAGVAPDRIALTGDSAGGGLAVALLVRLREQGVALPACVVGLSPWVDLAATGASIVALDGVDPWLSAALVRRAGESYAGDLPLDDPQVSPLYADLAGLPPMLVLVGSDEILLDDAVRLVQRARAAGVDASLGCFDGMWHVFPAFPFLPEADRALREIGGFVRRHTVAAPVPR